MNIPEFKKRTNDKKTRYYVDNEIVEIYAGKIKSYGIAIYNVLARHANSKTQTCFPSYVTIVKKSGIGNKNTVSKYIKKLEEVKLIKIIRNKNRKPNLYCLLDISNSTKIDTIHKEHCVQKNPIQYQNNMQDSNEIDTLNNIIESNKEIIDSFERETPFQKAMKSYKPPWKD